MNTAHPRPLTVFLVLVVSTHASGEISSRITREDFTAAVCNIASMTVDFKIDEVYDEPLVSSKMQWVNGPNTSTDCLSKLTFIHLRVIKADGTQGYIKLSPDVVAGGQGFGPTAAESPNWRRLICNSTADGAPCIGADEAKTVLASNPDISTFQVVTNTASIVKQAQLSPGAKAGRDDRRAESDDAFSFDSLLERTIDSTIAPQPAVSEPEPEPEEEPPPVPAISQEEIERLKAEQRREIADTAMSNVLTLVATSLAQHQAPAASCESERTITNMVRFQSLCQMHFRSESSHQFLCEDDRKPVDVAASQSVDLDFTNDVARIAPLRVADAGWIALVLELKGTLANTDAGDYQQSRWQFTTSSDRQEDMHKLASSLATLKEFCETRS